MNEDGVPARGWQVALIVVGGALLMVAIFVAAYLFG